MGMNKLHQSSHKWIRIRIKWERANKSSPNKKSKQIYTKWMKMYGQIYCIDIDDYVQLCQYIDIECLKKRLFIKN